MTLLTIFPLNDYDGLILQLLILQISEVVNSMKDLIDYSRETGTGPMGKQESLLLILSKCVVWPHGNSQLGMSLQYLALILSNIYDSL